jgi:hypothetical protein
VTERFGSLEEHSEGPSGNEFVIFSKPELGRLDEDRLGVVWDLFARSLADYGVRIHRVKIMTGPDLERAGAMQEHYGVINQISREGRPALTEAAEQALQQAYGDTLDGAEVIGGHQFLDRYPEVSAYALAMLFANADVERLGPGTYAAQLGWTPIGWLSSTASIRASSASSPPPTRRARSCTAAAPPTGRCCGRS